MAGMEVRTAPKPAPSRLTACKENTQTVHLLYGLARIYNSFYTCSLLNSSTSTVLTFYVVNLSLCQEAFSSFLSSSFILLCLASVNMVLSDFTFLQQDTMSKSNSTTVPHHSPSLREVKTETLRKEQKAGAAKECCLLLAFHGSFSLLSNSTQEHQPRCCTAYHELAPPTSVIH